MQHRDMNPSLSGFRQFLIVLAQTPATAQPGQRTLHHPPPGQHLEAVAVRASAYHAQQPASSSPSPSHQPADVGRISPDQLQSREPAQQLGQYQPGSIPVLDVGGVHHYREEQPGGIHYDVALAPGHLFARVIAARPPFSVVFTYWLSMMAALGVASLPSRSRTMGRSASSTRSQVPSARHLRKYHQTVPQGGRSWDINRQGMPPRKTYRMPFITSRRSTVRGWPLGESGGSRGSNRRHRRPDKSLGYVFRSIPQSYRQSRHHTKLSQRMFRPLSHTL